MSITALQDYTIVSKYSKWIQETQRRETWKEIINRVRQMMYQKYKDKDVDEYIDKAYDAVLKKKILGSQRALQFGGKPVFKHNARTYNCISSYIDRPEFFQQCMYLLLCGCGTGFSVQTHHVNKLPKLITKKQGRKKFVIPDSIEGWSDAVGVLVCSYFDTPGIWEGYSGKEVVFDDSQIREEGSPLSSGCGKAPGPEPLRKALSRIKKLLDNCLKAGYTKLRPIHVYDIVMHSADAVLSGGVRRSATICIFSADDKEMLEAKTGNWVYENPQRARANNSVLLLRNSTTWEQFASIIDLTKEFGEPGFVWADDPEFLVNPCCEVGFWCYNIANQDKYDKFMETYDGLGIKCKPKSIGLESGWQACNLSTLNCSKIKMEEEFYEACENAAILGTLQAGFSEFPYLGEVSEAIISREALLGVSMTGMMENPDICLDGEIQKKGANIVRKTNKKLAKLIGVNPAARTTCVKPEGTSSCLLGTSSGIHPHHAKRYIRHVQANKTEKTFQHLEAINPKACQDSVWSANDSDSVIAFCIEVPDGSKLKNQIGAIDLLKSVQTTQCNWVQSGKNRDLCTQKWLSHNVSNTIHIKNADEWQEVAQYIYNNRKDFCGVSLLPLSGDKDYAQAPFTAIYLPSEISRNYGDGSLFVSGLIEKGLELFDDDLWNACDAAMGRVKVKGSQKKSWVKRISVFATKYMDGDVRRTTYCMKDVFNWKKWIDLNREYKDVDYTKCLESEDNTNYEMEPSCAGGSCEI